MKLNYFFKSTFIPDLRSQVKSILDPYELPKEEATRRVDEVITDQRELFEYAQMNAYGEIAFNSYQAYKIFDGLKSPIDEGEFKLRPDKIELRFMDPQRIQLTEITFTTSTYRFFREGKVAVNVDDLARLLKASKSEKAISTIIFTDSGLKITKQSTELNIPIQDTLAALHLEFEEIPMETLLSLKYPFTFALRKEQFEYILKHTDIHSEVLGIKVNPERLEFGQHGQIGTRSIPLDKQDLKDLSFDPTRLEISNQDEEDDKEPCPHEALASYSLAYLKFVSKMIYLLDKKDTLTFHMKTDHPLLVEITLPLNHIGKGEVGTFAIRNFIACRDRDGDIDDDDYFEEF